MTPEYTVEIIEQPRDLEKLAAPWNQALDLVPTQKAGWIMSWWDQFSDCGTPYMISVWDRQRSLCGVLPLYRSHHRGPGRALRGMGDMGVCTDYFSLCAAPANRLEISRLIGTTLSRLAGDARLGWDWIDLDGVVASDFDMRECLRAMQAEGAVVHATSRMHCWRITGADDWESYLGSLGKNQRRKIRVLLRDFSRLPQLQLHHPHSAEDYARHLDAAIELHRDRWKAEGRQGIFADPRVEQFTRQWTRAAFESGDLHLPLLTFHGIPVAAEIGWAGGNRLVYIWCAGRTMREDLPLDVGTLLSSLTIKQSLEQGMLGVDYMRGDEIYKQRFGAQPSPCMQIRVASPHWSGKVIHAFWRTQFELTQFFRRRTGRSPLEVIPLLAC